MAAGTPTQIAPTLGYEAIVDLALTIPFRPRRQRFLFLRHGETEGNRTGIYQWPETPLNAEGEAQAAAAAERLRGVPLAHVAASPMMRAWRTAAVVTDGRDQTPEPDGGLQERLYLGLAGTPIGKLDWRAEHPACERLSTFVNRAAAAISRHLATPEDPEGELLLVAHGGVLLVLAAMTGIDPGAELRRNATPLLFSRESGGWTAEAL